MQLDSDQHVSLKSQDDTSDTPWGLARMSHRVSGDHPLYLGEELPHQTYAYVLDSGIRTTHEVGIVASAIASSPANPKQQFGGRALWGARFIGEEASDLVSVSRPSFAGSVAGILI